MIYPEDKRKLARLIAVDAENYDDASEHDVIAAQVRSDFLFVHGGVLTLEEVGEPLLSWALRTPKVRCPVIECTEHRQGV